MSSNGDTATVFEVLKLLFLALSKYSEFERKSCVEDISLWDICESMSSNMGGDGGGI